MDLIAASRQTVDELLDRRHQPMSYEQRVQYALDLVDMHLHEENPDRIDECIKLYTEDAIWDAPTRGVSYVGRQSIKQNYLKLFASAANISFEPIERFASPIACSTTCGRASPSPATASRTPRFPSAPRSSCACCTTSTSATA
jgi:hypothetical protein